MEEIHDYISWDFCKLHFFANVDIKIEIFFHLSDEHFDR